MDEVLIHGDGLALALRVAGYERYDSEGSDANWLTGEVELHLTGPAASAFRATCRVAWMTGDFVRFHESLRTLLDDLDGAAHFSTVEDQAEITIQLSAGKGTISGRVEEHVAARIEFSDIRTDQSQLQPALTALRRLVQKYPERP